MLKTSEKTTIEALLKILRDLTNKKFYGDLQIKFESGHIVYLKKTESIKL
jgi:hypothetical protein